MNDRLTAVGIVRQALAPLVKDWIDEQKELANVSEQLIPLLGKIEKRLGESPLVEIEVPEIDTLIERLDTLSKRDNTQEIALPDIQKLAEGLTHLSTTLKSRSIADYRPHDQSEVQGTEYSGFVSPTGSWYIIRAQEGEQRYASGKENYAESWTKRSKQNYDYLDKVM